MNSKELLLLLLTACLFVSTQCFLKPPAWKHCIKQLHALPKTWEVLQSPGYPNGMSSQMQCTWVIQSNPGTRIRLAFQNFNLTGSPNNCYTQSIEIFDLVKRASMGKMCGTRRAGDFVSFGNEMRIDLLADTSNHPHQGFRLRYKQTSGKDRSGFTTKFSFPNGADKKKKKKKPTASSSGGNKKSPPKKTTKWDTTGGKVNFAQLFKMRQQPRANQQPKRVTEIPELEGNSTKPVNNTIVPTAAPRTVKTKTRRQPVRRIYRPADRWQDRPFEEDDKKDKVSLYFIIGISIGGFFSILLIVFLIKVCFFSDKDKEKNKVYENYQMRQPPQQRDYGSYYYGEKQTEFIDNQHHLPSTARTTPLSLSSPEDLPSPPHYDVIADREPTRETMSDDEEETRRRRRRRNRNRQRRRDDAPKIDDDVTAESYVADRHRKPASHVTTPSDRMMRAATEPYEVPTLRRKLSPWEKEQLKIESRRMQPRDGIRPM